MFNNNNKKNTVLNDEYKQIALILPLNTQNVHIEHEKEN